MSTASEPVHTKRVVVTDRRTHVEGISRGTDTYEGPEPYVEAVEAAGGEVVFGEYETEDEVVAGVREATVVTISRCSSSRKPVASLH